MTALFNIELTIHMPDSGRHARQLLNLYLADDMSADIDEAAYNLCEANKAIQAQKFAKLNLKRADAWPNPEGGMKIFALMAVSGEDPTFIKQVIAHYVDGFADYLKKASGRYYSRTAFPPEISLQPTDWNAEVHTA